MNEVIMYIFSYTMDTIPVEHLFKDRSEKQIKTKKQKNENEINKPRSTTETSEV